MDGLLARYDAECLGNLSVDRRRASLRALTALAAVCDGDLGQAHADTLRRFVAADETGVRAPSTVLKERRMVLAFLAWAWRDGHLSGDVLLAIRAIPAPTMTAARGQPTPYRPGELRKLRAVLDERWPRLPPAKTTRWLDRWRDHHSPYSRIRSHAIRCQLDAVIALALRCALQRDEIRCIDVEAIHPDNSYIVVWDKAGPWQGTPRKVPYTDSMRKAIAPWVALHSRLAPGQTSPWLSLWSAETVGAAMTEATFARLLRNYIGVGWTLRRLRTTAIVTWIRAGVPLERLREMLGFADISELLPYARCVGGDTVREVNRRDERFAQLVDANTDTA